MKQERLFIGEALNEFASICWSVGTEEGYKGGQTNLYSSVRMTDCNKVITIDFSVYKEGDDTVEERLKKIRNLINSLENFEKAFKEVAKEWNGE